MPAPRIEQLSVSQQRELLNQLVLPSGYRRWRSGPWQAAVHAGMNQRLRDQPLRYRVRSSPAQLAPELAEALIPVLEARESAGQQLWDEPKPSLQDWITPQTVAAKTLELFEGTYFQGLISNEMACAQLWQGQRLALDGPAVVYPQGKVSPGRCADGVGVSTLAFSRDGKLILVRQPPGSAVGAGLWSPSGSGSLDWDDAFPARVSLQVALARAMERELYEETGARALRSQIIGYGRLLHRGGKPEFVGVTHIPEPASELLSPEGLELRAVAPEQIRNLMRRPHTLSPSLWLALRLWQQMPA